ncbi:LysR family transcriptional regulator [Geomicrobium sp. JCM 19039]|uniref:LysR family transcriptional regulator n=1 Tax=Geomicrobium sp. JCM 19039 TaxID=1460636 RepID=UPI00045F15E3|nr:LysR family transcriptional regulator [Geomicrobium sp. JCM 19039]GAK12472.1 transcriptional regulator, LysR family [Geomicrobium sp. JCM 19039]
MNLQKLEYFRMVAREKSITGAATKLFISQPALTKQIKSLEAELGFPLLIRFSYGIELTEKGQQFLKDIEPGLNELRFVMNKYRSDRIINMGSDPFLTTYYFPDYVDRFARLHIHMKHIEEDTLDLLPLIKKGEIDAAIVQDHANEEGLSSAWLFAEDFYVAFPTKYKPAKGAPINMKDCFAHTQLLSAAVSPLYKKIRQLMNVYEQSPEIIEMPYHSLMGLVSKGYGVSYLPAMVVNKIEYKGVTFLPIKDTPIRRDMYLYANNVETLQSLKKLFVD